MLATTVLVFDVDGVVSPVRGHTEWGDDVVAGNVFGPVWVSPTMSDSLDQLAIRPEIQCMWLTSWDAQMRARMNPFPGRDWPVVGTWSDVDATRDWWKLTALVRWLDNHPGVNAVAWCDDQLRGGRPAAVRRRLGLRGVDVLIVAPRTDVGLTPHHLRRLDSWLLR